MLEIKGFHVVLALAVAGCGGSKPNNPNDPSSDETTASPESSGAAASDTATAPPAAPGDDSKPKASSCTGFDIDLTAVLQQSACELAKPQEKSRDMKGVLDIKVTTSAAKVAPGAHVDLVVTFTNKSKDNVALDFVLDPTARFSTEAYDKKGHRVDVPSKPPPPLPTDIAERAASPQSMARIHLVPNGSAHAQIGWDAVTMKWAPDKVHGTPPEMGYPRVPAGKLGKGKYSVHVVTPLTNVLEGAEKEVSSPSVEVEVGR